MSAARTTVAGILLSATVVLAGCSALPFMGPACGPGDTSIGDIPDNATDVHVKGELTAFNGSSLVLDDGSGQARVMTLGEDLRSQVSTGDCIIARGPAVAEDNESYDAIMIPSDVWVEEYEAA